MPGSCWMIWSSQPSAIDLASNTVASMKNKRPAKRTFCPAPNTRTPGRRPRQQDRFSCLLGQVKILLITLFQIRNTPSDYATDSCQLPCLPCRPSPDMSIKREKIDTFRKHVDRIDTSPTSPATKSPQFSPPGAPLRGQRVVVGFVRVRSLRGWDPSPPAPLLPVRSGTWTKPSSAD